MPHALAALSADPGAAVGPGLPIGQNRDRSIHPSPAVTVTMLESWVSLAWGSEARIRSRGGAVVLVDQPTEQIPSANVARTDQQRVRRFGSWRGEAEGALGSPAVVVLDIGRERPIEMPPTEDRIAWADPKYLSAGRSAAATGRRRAALDMSPFDGPDELTSSQLVRTVFLLFREGAHDLELAA